MFSGQAFNETLSAFLTANKEGFHLADVSAAPLAKLLYERHLGSLPDDRDT